MSGYKLFNLLNMLNELGEKRVKVILSSFLCPQNKSDHSAFRNFMVLVGFYCNYNV